MSPEQCMYTNSTVRFQYCITETKENDRKLSHERLLNSNFS